MMKGVFHMCKKVNFSITNETDIFLTAAKEKTGFSKSFILSALVCGYGEELLKDMSKYGRKERTVKVSHME